MEVLRVYRRQNNVPREYGFTLLEIMLVLLIMAVATAMVLPNVFSPASGRLADEGRHLQQVLNLAEEEAQLRGVPIRWTVYADGYLFEMPNAEGAWQPMSGKPYVHYTLPPNVRIESVQVQGGFSREDKQRGKNPLLGYTTLFPDGMLTLADVTLASKTNRLQMQLRPGSGGIRIMEATP